jgi:hypothetical protein
MEVGVGEIPHHPSIQQAKLDIQVLWPEIKTLCCRFLFSLFLSF